MEILSLWLNDGSEDFNISWKVGGRGLAIAQKFLSLAEKWLGNLEHLMEG